MARSEYIEKTYTTIAQALKQNPWALVVYEDANGIWLFESSMDCLLFVQERNRRNDAGADTTGGQKDDPK